MKVRPKIFGIAVITLVLAIELFEVASWRNDYPFTRLGMYSGFHSFEPYVNIEIEFTDPAANEEILVKEPWLLRRRLWSLHGLGTPEAAMDKDLAQYKQIVESNVKRNREQIRSVLLSNLRNPSDIDGLRVKFLAWNKLAYGNTSRPDLEYVSFPPPASEGVR